MASASATATGDGRSTLKRCLDVLRDARNDSEQFAALLLVRDGCGATRAPSPEGQAGGSRSPRARAGLSGVGDFGQGAPVPRCCPQQGGGSLALGVLGVSQRCHALDWH